MNDVEYKHQSIRPSPVCKLHAELAAMLVNKLHTKKTVHDSGLVLTA